MIRPTVVGSALGVYDGDALTFTVPAGARAGDVAIVAWLSTDVIGGAVSAPFAWKPALAASGADEDLAVAWTVLDGTEEAIAFEQAGAAVDNAIGVLVVCRNTHRAIPFYASDGAGLIWMNYATPADAPADTVVAGQGVRAVADATVLAFAFADVAGSFAISYDMAAAGAPDDVISGQVLEQFEHTAGGETYVCAFRRAALTVASSFAPFNGAEFGYHEWTFSATADLWALEITLNGIDDTPRTFVELEETTASSASIILVGAGDGEEMRDFLLDPTTGDLVLTSDIHVVSGKEAIGQAIDLRLSLLRGEWFLDPNAGVDWFNEILVKNPPLARIESELRTVVLETEGVLAITAFTLALDRATRTLAITYSVSTDLGELKNQTFTFDDGAAA